MKLAQRIVIGYYTNKFRLLGMLSARSAAKAAFDLFCTPYSKRKKHKIPKIFLSAEKLSFGFDVYTINGFRWLPKEMNNGKTALICHGFDSYSYKFDRYVVPLLKAGFKVLAFDAPAHGVSTGKRINVAQYKQMVQIIEKKYGPVDSIIAHSFGALAVALAVEDLKNSEDKKLVLIAPATETTFAIETFFKHVPVAEKVRVEFEKLIAEIGGNPSSWYSVARVMKKISVPTLWVHDMDDQVTPYEHMHHLVELKPPHIEFEITNGLGHSAIYKDNKVKKRIIEFVSDKPVNSNNNLSIT